MQNKTELMDLIDCAQENDFCSSVKEKYKGLCEDLNQTVVFFGAGIMGIYWYECFKKWGFKPNCFCDNDEMRIGENVYDGVNCISFQDLLKLKNPKVIITVTSHEMQNEILKQLKTYKIKGEVFSDIHYVNYLEKTNVVTKIKEHKEEISLLYDILGDDISKKILSHRLQIVLNPYTFSNLDCHEIYTSDQYFPKELIDFSLIKTFVDCGAYIGDTLEFSVNNGLLDLWTNYFAFELSENNFKSLKKFVDNLDTNNRNKVEVINKGVGKLNEQILYNEMTSSSSACGKEGRLKGELVSLDSYFSDTQIDFIKMDIEGSETAAIEGGRNTIIRYKPILAICLYHKFEDLWEIPLLLKKLVPEYKLYIRHHEYTMFETVCYAKV